MNSPILSLIRVTGLDTKNLGKPSTPKSSITLLASFRSSHAPVNVAFSYPYANPPVALFLNASTEAAPINIAAPTGFVGA